MSEQTVELEIKDLSGKLVTLRPDGQGVIHLPFGTYESDTGVIFTVLLERSDPLAHND
jgi:hypothetical protein